MPAGPPPAPPLLQVTGLRARFPVRTGLLARVTEWIDAVDGVSFEIEAGEALGLVGASGCGKTTVGRTILRLIPAAGGDVRFRGESILGLPRRRMQQVRREMQIIFQDPVGSLNPRMKGGAIVGEPLLVHGLARGRALAGRVADLLARCGLRPAAAARYPHEFSGGQRQRIAIARALALRPSLIVCDEPTSALDVSVQSQILNLLQDLQDEYRLAYLFISHDMAVVSHLCHRIAVMHAGRIVEIGARDRVLESPAAPETRRLLQAIPTLEPRRTG